ncbi:MAG TPA: thioesterase family protein, partial [Beijerinckiaceae bacterium]|nr:thioesterase family protein [Beijerinckiaceae bacterium]
WARTVEEYDMSASMLAIFADYVPSAIGPALGEANSGSSSLDNTLRVRKVVPTRWVFCDITVTGMNAGFAHGDMRLFAENGELMATASQSMVVRRRGE